MRRELTLASGPPQDAASCGQRPGGICRWGDYAGASPDPRNPSIVWGSGQLASTTTGNANAPTFNFALPVR
jgi:hypothetical protein